jgi:TetR/AcrR family transcriptional regulator, transcriptional repressor for nem operon
MTRRPWPARRALGRGRGIAVCASSRRRACSLQTERAARRGEARYCRDRRDLSLGLFLSRLYDSFADLLRRRAPRPWCSHRRGGTRLPAWSRFLTSRSRTCIVRLSDQSTPVGFVARPREFDLEEVLDRAVETFWSKGYEATSIRDLVHSMGIHRASLYVAFGDKQRLFLSVLDRYRQMVVRKLLDILDSCPSGRAAIRQFFGTVVEHVVTGGPLRGCLVTNSAVERGLSDPATAKKVSLCLTQLEDGFYATLLRAQRGGELDQRRDLRALARYLTSSLQGLLVIGKIQTDRAALEDVVEVTLRALD